jgi:uncharacterized protein YggE
MNPDDVFLTNNLFRLPLLRLQIVVEGEPFERADRLYIKFIRGRVRKMLKSIKLLILVGFVAAAVATCTAVQAAPDAESQIARPSSDAPRTITVVGQGRIRLTPDIAILNVGAEARASAVSEAKAEVDAQMSAITAALQEAGVADKDVQTSHYGIHFEREPLSPVREGPALENQGAYVVSTMVQVTIRDVEQAGDTLDGVIQAGANQVYGITFSVADESAGQSQARATAMADARGRAQELAGLADLELGEVLSVSEIIGGVPNPAMLSAERGLGGGGFAPGELELGTQIEVTFAVK